ncbi:hypothetical protein [Oceanivirga salmonicida]|uniref:hypothetical protein n=1 Tax=Oceanivirga salmonicida TaxID=1769291 RepID=UPI0012E25E1D|nr:hypothetical protein [Oceanivirga salmonicida]
MKKTLLITSFIITTMSFAGFNVRLGAEYNNSKLNNNKSHIVLGGAEIEYSKSVLEKGKVSFEIAGGADIKVGYGKASHLDDILTDNTANKLLAYKNATEKVRTTEKKLQEGRQELETNPNSNNLKNKVKQAEKFLEDSKKEEKIAKKAFEDAHKDDTNLKDKKLQKKASENVIKFNTVPYILPQIKYNINQNTDLRFGLKVGVGYEGTYYLGRKADNTVEAFNIKETNNNGKRTYTKQKGITKIGKSLESSIVVPASAVIGFDYKHITTNLEAGAKYLYNINRKEHQVAPLVSLNIGYSF